MGYAANSFINNYCLLILLIKCKFINYVVVLLYLELFALIL